jgi:hypothetical protein
MGRTRLRVAIACLAIAAAAALASIGSAGNREATVTFAAVPGPTQVTAGQPFAVTSTFENEGRSTFTHVELHMSVPTGAAGSATLVSASCDEVIENGELVCGFDKVRKNDPPLKVTVVWQTPPGGACDGCLTSKAYWQIKERGHDRNSKNDTFPAGTVAIALLAADDPSRAAGFATSACGNPFGAGTLQTDPDVDASDPVSSTVCLPPFTTSATDLGVASAITEGPAAPGQPGHPALGRSVICVAAFGQSCGAEGTYTPFDFGFATPIQFVFRISAAALGKYDKITKVFHNGAQLGKCPNTDPNGCVVAITPPKSSYSKHGGPSHGKGVWTVVAKAPTNGPWSW